MELDDWKQYRRDLRSHLYKEHGRFTPSEYGAYSMDQLEMIHEAFHLEGLSTPHSHKDSAPYRLGAVVAKFSTKEIKRIIREATEGE